MMWSLEMEGKSAHFKWLDWGVDGVTDLREKKRVHLSNLMSITMFAALFPYLPVYVFLGWYGIAAGTAAVLVVFAVVPWCNRAGHIHASRWLLLLAGYVDACFLLLTLGSSSGIHLGGVALIILPMLLFGVGSVPRLMVGAVAALLLYWTGHFIVIPSPLPSFYQHLLHFFFSLTIISVNFLFVYSLIKTNERHEGELVKAHQAQSEFLANMSHELRTPLNAIIGYAEILQEDAEDGALVPTSVQQDTQKILGSARHLLALINDLLDISKIEAGRVQFALEPVDVKDFCSQIEALLQPLVRLQDNQLTLVLAQEFPKVSFDPVKLRQCLFNLLSNAAKFTKQGQIELRVALQPVDKSGAKGLLCFVVEDTGIGMSDEELEKLFAPYVQMNRAPLERNSSMHRGTGLGMAITHKLCQLMGAELKVESEIGVGTVCLLCLPVAICQEDLPITSVPSDSPLAA